MIEAARIPKTTQSPSRVAAALLGASFVALIGSLGIGTARISGVHTVSYDGAISYLAATAHQGDYAQENAANRWVPASEWQSLWTPSEFGAFRAIGEDLARNDIHPPLYFWLLHVWVHAFGIAPTSGLYLNLLFMIATAACLYVAGRSYRCSVPIATTAAALWALSGATLQVLDEARPYMLLALVSAAFLWRLGAFLRRPAWTSSVAVGAVAFIGVLIHYHFILVIASGAAVTFVALASKRNWIAALKGAVAVTLAATAFVLVHPLFYLSFRQQREQGQPFSATEVPRRVSKTLRETFGLVLPESVAWWITFHIAEVALLLLAALLIVAAVSHIRRRIAGLLIRIGWVVHRSAKSTCDYVPAAMFALTFGAIASLYLLFLSPKHAMGPKYTAIASPFLFVALGQVLQLAYERVQTLGASFRLLLLGAVCSLLGLQAGAALLLAPHDRSRPVHPAAQEGHPLIIDTLRRGELPPLLWNLPPKTPIYASDSQSLISSFPDRIPDTDTLNYVSVNRHRGEDITETVLSELKARGYTRVDVIPHGPATIYILASQPNHYLP